jgi:mono/diheme cytochrome c family protein
MCPGSRLPGRTRQWLLLAVWVLVAGCSPRLTYQAMADQPRYQAYEGSDILPHGQSAQLPPAGTVPRGFLRDDALLAAGQAEDGTPADVFPFEVTRPMLVAGQRQYNAFCVPCHDYAGTGQGAVVERGFTPPPSFHTDTLRNTTVGQLYAVITHGQGAMPAYSEQIAVRDRWAIVAYVRALQLSQYAALDDVPPDQREAITVREVQP